MRNYFQAKKKGITSSASVQQITLNYITYSFDIIISYVIKLAYISIIKLCIIISIKYNVIFS